jgi:hypothetical protein
MNTVTPRSMISGTLPWRSAITGVPEAGESAARAQPPAYGFGGARLSATARAAPLEGAALQHEAVNGIGHVGEPRRAAELTVGANLQAGLLFVLEGAQHRSILMFAVVQPELMYPGSDQEDVPLALQAIFRNDVKQ